MRTFRFWLLSAWLLLSAGVATAGECGGTIRGDETSETIIGTACADFIFANAGDDTVRGLGDDDFLDGQAGNDSLYGGPGDDSISGRDGDDLLYGEEGDDTLLGGGGVDRCYGGPGDDEVDGRVGNDYLEGGPGANRIDGGVENDVLVGRSGQDFLIGESGHDFFVIVGNSADGYEIFGDRSLGGDGDDLLFFAREANPEMVFDLPGTGYLGIHLDLRTALPVVIDLGQVSSIEAVATGDGDDRLTGTDLVARLTYKDLLKPLEVDELFISGAGSDAIDTRDGNDYVNAGAGNDEVIFGSGSYYVETGAGKDTLRWNAARWQDDTVSTVVDFAVGDVILLEGVANPRGLAFSASEDDEGPVTSVSLDGTERIRLRHVVPEAVRTQRAGDLIEIRVLASLPPPRTESPRLFRGMVGGGS